MPNTKTGQNVPCFACGKLFYVSGHYLARGHKRMACKNPDCRSKAVSGENNPFWGKIHDDKTKAMIRETKRAKPQKKRSKMLAGYKQSPEARAKMSEALRLRWKENRDKMLAGREHLRNTNPRELQRYRRNFTPLQRREWKLSFCEWCKATEKLVLDHIIPVSCGGTYERRNAQTLCQPCNLWKMSHVDRPLFLAGLGK